MSPKAIALAALPPSSRTASSVFLRVVRTTRLFPSKAVSLFKNGVFTELSDAKNATTVNTASNYFYTFIYNSGSYAGDYTLTIYNVNGEKIMTQIVANSTYSVNPYGDCVLVSYNVSAYDYTTGYNKTSVNYAVIK